LSIEWKDYSRLKPLGNRILVKRLSLPDVRESGLYLIGRDYPTMGKVLAVGNGPRYWGHKYKSEQGLRVYWVIDVKPNDLVQWSIDSNFDLKQIGRAADGGDLFLFDYDDLNFVGREVCGGRIASDFCCRCGKIQTYGDFCERLI